MLVERIKRLGGFGIALCKCGHLSSDHGSRLTPVDKNHTLREYNHGGCCECACSMFTFHRYVSLEDAAAIIREKETQKTRR